ncbi:MAG TPA: YkgJ family cysteine cluster protein [Phycisphaerales bacterium]|nr:YkgJ family cysteine cluster protein [Phycisphaerales bacterium]
MSPPTRPRTAGSEAPAAAAPARPREWFAEGLPDDAPALSFGCTLCGNCCSGPPGYVLVSDAEARALAARLKITLADFLARYTAITPEGRSLIEKPSPRGLDCVFLDRAAVPGKAVCGVYEDRPAQCRTWPFWPSVVRSRAAWERAGRTCPGMGRGRPYTVQQVRVLRDAVKI